MAPLQGHKLLHSDIYGNDLKIFSRISAPNGILLVPYRWKRRGL